MPLAPSLAVPEHEANTSIDSRMGQDENLGFILNPALECGIDRIISHSLGNPSRRPEPYLSIDQCVQALSGCMTAFLNLQNEGFCEGVFNIMVEDPSRPEVAQLVHVSLEELKLLVASFSTPRTSEWEDKLLRMYCGVARLPKSCEHEIGDINCISTCWIHEDDFRDEGIDSFENGARKRKRLTLSDARRKIIDFIKMFEYTGIDHDGNLQAWWPFTDTPMTCSISRVTENEVNNWFLLIKDTRDTSAFPVVSQRCSEFRGQGIIQQCSRQCKNCHSHLVLTGLSTRIMLDPLWLSVRGSKNQQRNKAPAEADLAEGTKLVVGETHLTVENECKGEQTAAVAAISTNPLYYKLGAASRLLL